MADEWIAVEGEKNFWNPTKDEEEIVGKLAAIEDGMYGKKYTMQIVKDGKDEMIVMPSHKVLQSRLAGCALGEEIKIIFKGTQPPKVRGENPTRIYIVLRKKPVSEELVK